MENNHTDYNNKYFVLLDRNISIFQNNKNWYYNLGAIQR